MHQSGYSYIFHIQDMGISNWIFPRWKAVKHHQWMILTPEFIKYLKPYFLKLIDLISISKNKILKI